jgi:sulfite reductase beta subunit-like hemoprotein
MKYLVESRGIDWFRDEVQRRVGGLRIEPPKEIHFDTVEDLLGWHSQGDDKFFCGIPVSMGRISDRPNGPAYKSAFRKIVEKFRCPVVITPNTNLIFADIHAKDKIAFDAILAEHHVPHAKGMTVARRVAHACVALPTCGLSLSESERVFDGVMDKIDNILREFDLADEPILFRMTGCPNGCARPYHADIGFVGRAPGKYAMYVGGSIRGDRLAGLEKKVVTLDEIPATVRPILEEFAATRQPGERFCDWTARTRDLGPAPHADQFHVEFAERAAKLAAAGEKAVAVAE